MPSSQGALAHAVSRYGAVSPTLQTHSPHLPNNNCPQNQNRYITASQISSTIGNSHSTDFCTTNPYMVPKHKHFPNRWPFNSSAHHQPTSSGMQTQGIAETLKVQAPPGERLLGIHVKPTMGMRVMLSTQVLSFQMPDASGNSPAKPQSTFCKPYAMAVFL